MNTKKKIIICTAAIVMSAAMFFAACDNPWIGGTPGSTHDMTPTFMQMVEIQAGDLTSWFGVTITLSAFQMGIYEVTQNQYLEVMGVNPSYFSSDPATGETQGERPVERVTWYDAIEFCNKLSEKNGLTPVYTITGRTPAAGYPITDAAVTANWENNGYRLPTEAQWEYAVRAGSTTSFYFGNTDAELVNYAWYDANANGMTHQVGKKTANDWGLHDMYGNVWEMCWDLTSNPPSPYPVTDQTDYKGSDSGDRRIMRGGAYSLQPVPSGIRGIVNPNTTGHALGFRVVLPSSGHVHNFSGAWQKDATHHWKKCADDNAIAQKAAHVDTTSDDKCDVCGNDMPPGALLFTLINNNTAYSVAMGTSTDTEIVIPETHLGKPVTQIAANGFNASTYPKAANMTNITIPSSITSIDSSYSMYSSTTFAGSGIWNSAGDNSVVYADKWAVGYKGTAIGSLNLRDDTVGIGNFAFYGCNGFTGSLIIPNSVTYIGNSAFDGCQGFTGSLTIPNSVITIGNSAFALCIGFTGSLTIPNSVTSIGAAAFSVCGFTGDLSIPASVLTIGIQPSPNFINQNLNLSPAFSINKFDSFIVDAANPNYKSVDGMLYNKTGTMLIQAPGQISGHVIIPSGVTSIGNSAFSYIVGFTAVTIPSSVTSIADSAFINCNDLISVTFLGTIASVNFSSDMFTFHGNLREVFYAANPTNGTPGTYMWNGYGGTWEMQTP